MSKRNRNRNRDGQKKGNDGASSSNGSDKASPATEGPGSGGSDDEDEGGEGDGGGQSAGSTGDGATSSEVAAAGPATAAVADPAPAAMSASAPVTEPAPSAAPAAPAEVIAFPAPKPAKPVVQVAPELAALVEKLRTGRCVLWAGSNLDEQSGGVGFRGIVDRLLSELPSSAETGEARELLKRRPFLVAGYVRRHLGARFDGAIRDAARGPAELPEALRLLGELPFRAVVTTGFSDLLPRAFSRDGALPAVFTPADAAAMKDYRKPYVLKALGDPAREGTVVFSAKDLQQALGEDRLATAVRDFYKNRTILFLGVDSAIDLDRLFVRLLQGAGEGAAEHYMVVPGLTSLEKDELETTYNVKVIDHKDTFALIRTLREAVGDFREALPDDDDLEGWLGLLSADPERADGLEKIAAMEKKFAASNQHDRLLELHLGMTEVEQGHAGRAHRLHEMARLFEKEMGEPAQAFTALLAAFKEDPANEQGHADDLERLAGVTGSWGELLSEYTQITGSLPEVVRADHWVRVARLYSDKLNHHEYALVSVAEAIKLDPNHHGAEAVRVEALRKAEKWADLVEALGKAAAHEDSLSKKSELYLEQGDILETRVSDMTGAAKAYRGALDADPGSQDALNALDHLYRRTADWKELAGVLDEKAKNADSERGHELRREAATIVGDKLGDRKGALARFESLRADDGNDLVVLRALEKLYEAEEKNEEYLEVLAAQADLTKGEEKVSLYRRLAAEWEDRPDGLDHAAGYLEKILSAEPRNEDALRSVERLYTKARKWEALVDALRRHVDAPGADKTALSIQIAQTLETEIKEPNRAIDAWEQVLKLVPHHDEAILALTRLNDAQGNFEKALALYDQRAESARDKESKVKALYDSGRLAADRLGDVKQAESRYHKALELDPQHVPSMTAMVELYRKSGEFLRAAKLLVEAEACTSNRLEKTRMLVEAGEIYDSLEQHTTATDLLLKAMQVDPEHVEAGNRVADLLWKAERYQDLVPILDMLTRKEADKTTQKTRYLRLGRASRAIGQQEKAARAYMKAAEIDNTDVEAQRACGQLFFGEGKWAEAREAFKAVLGHGGDDLSDAERVDLYYHLGECDRKLGHIDKAKNFYAKALEIDPTHRPTILARIDVDGDDPLKIMEAKRALLATANDDEKIKLLTEIGEMQIDKLGDPAGGVAAWREALAVRPDSRALLHKCLNAYVETKDWVQALEMLGKLTDAETIPTIRAKLRFTSAVIHLEELSDTESAIKLLSDAYEDDSNATRVSEKLEELLNQTENWKELQRFYRKVIKKLPEAETDTPEKRAERLRIWSALADVSIEKLGELGVGLSALEVAATFEPQNQKRKEQLADLYITGGPDYTDKAIAAHQILLKAQHDRVASMRALRVLYQQAKQPDKALAVAYALSFLKKGAPEDTEMVNEAKKKPLQPARRNLDDDLWNKCLVHPDESPYVNALFKELTTTLALANAKEAKDIPLNRKDKVESTDPRGFAKGVRYVAGVLNLTLPFETYVKYEQRDALGLANTKDAKNTVVPALLVGQPLLGDKRSEREMIFELTKKLAFVRSDRYLRLVLTQAAQLGLVIDAAIQLGTEMAPGKSGQAVELSKIAQDLKRGLPPKVLEQVGLIGGKLKGQKGEALATAWMAASELTAARAAFLLVGDLETTARFVAAEPPTTSTHPALHRLKEIIHFSISEECFTLRKHLGLMA